jgi:uncharacterized membrane protein YoaK (UPF0700 family)
MPTVLERLVKLIHIVAKARPGESVHESLPFAALLAVCGGFLDAFTYVGYGHVFANAMSGNVVLTGVAVMSREWGEVWWHLLPVVAFLAGVSAAEVLLLPQVRAIVRHPAPACLGLEVAFLAIAAGTGHLPAAVMTAGISFVAAVQTTTSRQLGGRPYSSTMITGDLRSFGTAVFAGLSTGDTREKRTAVRLAVVCVAFAVGAAAGACCAPMLGTAALWILAGLLTLGLAVSTAGSLLRQESPS